MRYFYKVTLDRVVDGDTVDVIIDLGFDVLHKARIRLYGVNTPETRTRDLEEKELGLKAKSFVQNWLSQSDHFFIQTFKDAGGKYGRILGNIYLDEERAKCLNTDLLDNDHATEYFGGKR
jgi:micrococcal nuclease